MNIISIVPTDNQGNYAVTLTINAGDYNAITPTIHAESDFRIAVVRACHLLDGLTGSGNVVKIAVSTEPVRSVLWDALYADGVANPDELITTDVPQGALDAVTLLGGAR